jgi:hypothetical protein
VWVSAVWVKNILAALPNDKDASVQIAVDFGIKKPAMDFSVAGNESIHIVYSRLKDGA